MRIARLAILAFFPAFALVFVLGCGNKRHECKAIIGTLDDDDAVLKGIDLDSNDYKTLSANLTKAAAVLDKLGKDLSGLTVKDATLVKASSDYQDFAKSLAAELRDHADLVAKLGETLEKTAPMARSLTAGLDKLRARCKATNKAVAGDCASIHETMNDAPDQDAFMFDKDLKEDADAFARFAGELKGLTPADAELKAALGYIVSGIGTLETVMRSLSDLEPKFDANRASLKATLAKEAPIERHINETCATS